MFTDEKAIEILKGLLEKSRANQVAWEIKSPISGHLGSIDEIDSFRIVLPESSVMIRFFSPDIEPDCFMVWFNNKNDVMVKRLEIDENHSAWGLAQELFDEAGRVTVGWDQVLNDLQKAVQSKERIGTPAK
jgi:hypothetical protein